MLAICTMRSLVKEWGFIRALCRHLLFITMIEAQSIELEMGCPLELLYVDDLMIGAESMLNVKT